MRGNTKHLTVGFLCANIHIGVSRTLWPGVVEAACELDANLVCFPGGGIGVQAGGEAQRNIIYELANAARLDGVVSWATTLGVELSHPAVVEFHRRFQPLPLITLALPIEGIPSVSVDDYFGMRSAVTHLLEVHRLRRLVMIRGPEGHHSAQERYRAYLDVMAEYGIEINPQLITPPLSWYEVEAAVRILLEERGLVPGIDFDGIVTASDLFSVSIVKALQARGVPVPGKVAIVGFNNMAESHLVSPPLTTVAPHFHNLGYQGVKELLDMIGGTPPPAHIRLPSGLIVRQSCGCPPQSVIEAALGAQTIARNTNPFGSPAWRAQLIAEMNRQVPEADGTEPLLAAFETALKSGAHWDFLHTFEAILLQEDARDGDITSWQAVISTLRRHTLDGLDGPTRIRCEDLCGQARVIIGEMAQRAQAYRQLQAERQSETLREIGQALITTFDIDKLAEVLVDRLPQIGISSCFMALYEDPVNPLDSARMVLAFSQNRRMPLPPDGILYPTRQLIPESLLPDSRFSLMVEPLYFQREPIGFALFGIGPLDGSVYEVLRAQISSALKGALLFREVQGQQRRLAESEAQLKELSIRDPLTGLYNRRFLEETLEREIHKSERSQHSLGMIMIDIDHFKRFNDLYGHATGDELLRQLGALLIRYIRGSDAACRFGGEEFVIILPEATLAATQERAEFLRHITSQIQVFYQELAVEMVTLSLGVAAFPLHGANGQALLKAADTALYRAKNEGRDRVIVAG
jgi:diguanylate cyclase (GGDEF)-like protein